MQQKINDDIDKMIIKIPQNGSIILYKWWLTANNFHQSHILLASIFGRVAQWVKWLDYLTTHTSLSPIRRGFAPGFVS